MDYQAIQSICNQLSDCEYVFYYSDSKISPILLTKSTPGASFSDCFSN
jgi:hypothetical protein